MPAPRKPAAKVAPTPIKKRKLDKNMPKFYAVRAGYHPGVYYTWSECEAQTTGFKGAKYKSFLTKEEADRFVAGEDVGGPSDKTEKWYAVAIGSRPGIYTDWTEAQKAYSGVKGPKYRKFLSRAEAEQYLRAFGVRGRDEDEEDEEDEDEDEEAEDDDEEDEEEEDEQPQAKRQKTSKATAKLIDIWTDGSSIGNGKQGAFAGLGVYFGKNDPRNFGEPLRGDVQTNQRAELTAIQRALESVKETQGVRIISDSKYSISCVTDWYRSWERNGWKTREGDVKNKDLVQGIRALIARRDARGTKTVFEWVKGHANDEGNIGADQLAVQGAKKR